MAGTSGGGLRRPLLLGQTAHHGLVDAYRAYLNRHPGELAAIREARPTGPLAVTHMTGMQRRPSPRRYDFILVPQDVEVERVTHHYEQAVAAGSDHGLVVADLRIPPCRSRSGLAPVSRVTVAAGRRFHDELAGREHQG